MQPLRLLSASLLASAFALHATAQSPTLKTQPSPAYILPDTPQTYPVTPFITPQPYQPITILPAPKPTPQSSDTAIAANQLARQIVILSAQNHPPCYALRSYGFTAKDIQSPNPHASNYTECTPASTVARKEILAVPATTVASTLQTIPTK